MEILSLLHEESKRKIEAYKIINDSFAVDFHGTIITQVRMVSKDGKVSYSEIVKVYIGKIIASIIVAPNPVLNGVIHLGFQNEPLGEYGITITNLIGQTILSRNIIHTSINGSETIATSSITPGVYQLSITKPDGNIEVIKIVY